jgi:hypothetical protein
MGNDLPDYQISVSTGALEASSFRSGADSAKPAAPSVGDIWLATDTLKLYICAAAGAWTGFSASMLVTGIITLFANMVAGGYKITGLGAPSATDDAARKAEVDAVSALLDDVTQAEPTRVIDTIYQNTGGKIRIVAITVSMDATDSIGFFVDSVTPPVTRVARMYEAGAANYFLSTVTFVVPPGYYYKAETEAATPLIIEWLEWDLH